MGTQPESKHTPGPWRVHVRPSDNVRMILPVDGQLSVCNVTDFGGMPAEANAHLIAAAPELLEACRKLVAAMREYEWYVDSPRPPKHDRMMSLAEAAIAKASFDNQSDDMGQNTSSCE